MLPGLIAWEALADLCIWSTTANEVMRHRVLVFVLWVSFLRGGWRRRFVVVGFVLVFFFFFFLKTNNK